MIGKRRSEKRERTATTAISSIAKNPDFLTQLASFPF
jgi:hypothetical protein